MQGAFDNSLSGQTPSALPAVQEGRARVVIERVTPQINGGRFPIKRIVGEQVVVEADIFTDAHDHLSAVLRYRQEDQAQWSEVAMHPVNNDRWRGEFHVEALVPYRYTIVGWVDPFVTWQSDMRKRIAASQDIRVDLQIGIDMVERAFARSSGSDKERLTHYQQRLQAALSLEETAKLIDDSELLDLMRRWHPRNFQATYDCELSVNVERPRAAFGAWYEMFPRSAADQPGHGTLKDVQARLPYVASMRFDVLYLPPIHPIGRAYRKGPNNAPSAGPDDPGSPWAIGAEQGGHKAIHPELGTMADFRELVDAASRLDIEIALDIAFQCAPDHPYVREHPEWFRKRPDGTIQYAENPPKKYQDIYPFDFECDDWRALWEELKSIFLFWLDEGVRIFRVDNPHTKPFPFWEWVIAEIRRSHPDAIFLAEAFTRPKVMNRLAKLGFTQSYTYFTWRDTKLELTEYFTELAQPEMRDFFRPNLWPNTPDILPASLQTGGRGAFMARLVLAATLSGNYGIYGPPFEHGWSQPAEPGSEEYLNSEKYEVHQHDIHRSDSLREFIAQINAIRRDSPDVFQRGKLEFHETQDEQVICFTRSTADLSEIVLVVVNLDPHQTHVAQLELPDDQFELATATHFAAGDLLSGTEIEWHEGRIRIELDPAVCPACIIRLTDARVLSHSHQSVTSRELEPRATEGARVG